MSRRREVEQKFEILLLTQNGRAEMKSGAKES
jgi:hypothetical protein